MYSSLWFSQREVERGREGEREVERGRERQREAERKTKMLSKGPKAPLPLKVNSNRNSTEAEERCCRHSGHQKKKKTKPCCYAVAKDKLYPSSNLWIPNCVFVCVFFSIAVLFSGETHKFCSWLLWWFLPPVVFSPFRLQ